MSIGPRERLDERNAISSKDSSRANEQEQQHWADEMEVGPVGKFYNRPLWGRTAGMLGYGALGRETARLLKAHGMRIIAANSTGKASKFEDWTPEGTGDLDGESEPLPAVGLVCVQLTNQVPSRTSTTPSKTRRNSSSSYGTRTCSFVLCQERRRRGISSMPRS